MFGSVSVSLSPEQQAILVAFALIGFLDVVAWLFRKFVAWTHVMRLLWRKLRSEPDPKILSD